MQARSGNLLGLLLLSLFLPTIAGGCSEPTRARATPATGAIETDRPGSPPRDAYETFDVVWTTIDEQHFDPEHNGVDWDEVRATYRPRIEDTRSQADVRYLLSEMINELDQSHFVIVPSAANVDRSDRDETGSSGSTALDEGDDVSEDSDLLPADMEEEIVTSAEGYTGIRLDFEGDDIVVVQIERGSPAEKAGIEPGWRVATIDGRDPNKIFRSALATADEDGSHMASYYVYAGMNAMASGSPGVERTFEFIDANDETVEVVVEVQSKTGETTDFMQLGPMTTKFTARVLSDEDMRSLGFGGEDPREPRILLITFDNWMFPIMGPLRTAMDEHRDVDGIIIDLRGNPGGAGGLAMGVAGFFLDEPLSLGEMKMRETGMHFRVNPQKVTLDGRIVEPFAKPLVILVDSGSASTSEIFAGGMQKLDRATVVGRRTAGAALPAHLVSLPNGDRFMYAVADFLDPNGETIEGVGVSPDLDVPIDRNLLAERRDPDLAAAIDVILADTTD